MPWWRWCAISAGLNWARAVWSEPMGGTAKMALEAATLAPYVEFAELRLNIDYAQLQPLTYHLNKAGGEIVAKAFGAMVELVVKLPAAEAAAFRERYARKT